MMMNKARHEQTPLERAAHIAKFSQPYERQTGLSPFWKGLGLAFMVAALLIIGWLIGWAVVELAVEYTRQMNP